VLHTVVCTLHFVKLFLGPSPPRNLAANVKLIDSDPVVNITWDVSMCVCVCCVLCVSQHNQVVKASAW